jgi:predicted phosphoribosyltransferase
MKANTTTGTHLARYQERRAGDTAVKLLGVGAAQGPSAAEVAASATVRFFGTPHEVDEVVCPYALDDLGAVGLWYADFSAVDDNQVNELLHQADAARHLTPSPT